MYLVAFFSVKLLLIITTILTLHKLAWEEWFHWVKDALKSIPEGQTSHTTPHQAKWALFFLRFQVTKSYWSDSKNVS